MMFAGGGGVISHSLVFRKNEAIATQKGLGRIWAKLRFRARRIKLKL